MRTDEELMLLFREGSRDAFEELFSRHQRAVVRFAFRMTGNAASAEEASQEIFLRIARAAGTYRPTAKFTTWMYTIARHAVLNFLRDTAVEGEGIPIASDEVQDGETREIRLLAPEDRNPETVMWGVQLKERFLSALQELPEGYRAAFVLNRGEGFSYDETAGILGITVQAVKTRIFRTREMLLRSLSEDLK